MVYITPKLTPNSFKLYHSKEKVDSAIVNYQILVWNYLNTALGYNTFLW